MTHKIMLLIKAGLLISAATLFAAVLFFLIGVGGIVRVNALQVL